MDCTIYSAFRDKFPEVEITSEVSNAISRALVCNTGNKILGDIVKKTRKGMSPSERALFKSKQTEGIVGILTDNYVIGRLKLSILNCIRRKLKLRSMIFSICKNFNIYKCDYEFVYKLATNENLVKEVHAIGNFEPMPKTLKQYHDMCSLIYTTTAPYIGKFVNAKLKFITRGFTYIETTDLKSVLLEQAVVSVCKKFPCVNSEVHLMSLAHIALKNKGKDIINYYTCAVRSAFITNEDGTVDMVNTHFSSFKDSELPQALTPIVNINGEQNDSNPLDQLFLKKAIDKFKIDRPRNEIKLLEILTGEYDIEFTMFSDIKNKHNEILDNDTRFHSCMKSGRYSPYINSALRYTGVTRDEWKSLSCDIIDFITKGALHYEEKN